jgi:hypothetical protein
MAVMRYFEVISDELNLDRNNIFTEAKYVATTAQVTGTTKQI